MFRILVTRSAVLIWFRRSDPIFKTGNDTVRSAYHFESKCIKTMSTREDWNKGSRPPPVLKGVVWYRNGLRTLWDSDWRLLVMQEKDRHTADFQAEIWAIFACGYEIQRPVRSEKYISIFRDS